MLGIVIKSMKITNNLKHFQVICINMTFRYYATNTPLDLTTSIFPLDKTLQ